MTLSTASTQQNLDSLQIKITPTYSEILLKFGELETYLHELLDTCTTNRTAATRNELRCREDWTYHEGRDPISIKIQSDTTRSHHEIEFQRATIPVLQKAHVCTIIFNPKEFRIILLGEYGQNQTDLNLRKAANSTNLNFADQVLEDLMIIVKSIAQSLQVLEFQKESDAVEGDSSSDRFILNLWRNVMKILARLAIQFTP